MYLIVFYFIAWKLKLNWINNEEMIDIFSIDKFQKQFTIVTTDIYTDNHTINIIFSVSIRVQWTNKTENQIRLTMQTKVP